MTRLKINGTAMILSAALVIGAGASVAQAQEAPGVTLKASKGAIDFGDGVRLSGKVSPPSDGATVSIIDGSGRERATTTTNADGEYEVRVAPRRTTQFRARWLAVVSEPERIKVRPKATVALQRVRLFGKARITGTVKPAQDAGRVTVTLSRGGSRLWQRKLRLRDGRRFSTSFEVRRAKAYRATASFTDEWGARGSDRSAAVSPPLPSLRPGSPGVYVKLLETRLRDLAYYLVGSDRRYTERTADAVRAFNKVEGRARLGTVDAGTWRALADARRARARNRTDGFHIEVDQTRQVLLMVRDAKVTGILHVSTGANGYTHDGTFRVNRKINGYSGGRLYYPSYFHGRRALHGWPEVPTYNASHGCVRLPMWAAKWAYGKADMGTTIHIYH